jgi:predicted MFS family arabinose efflux permease
MGAVTAAYAVGSIAFAKIIAWRVEADSVGAAFVAIACTLAVLVIIAAFMLYRAKANYGKAPPAVHGAVERLDRRRLLQFWFAYLSAVFAGLMAIGHAAGIAQSRGADVELATATAMMVGIGSALGGFIAGWLVDRWPLTRFMVALPLVSAVALLAICVTTNSYATLLLLGIVGFVYGSIIAIYPVAISNVFQEQGPQAYGRVFIAWGFAGLVAPWTAGFIYDWQAGYEAALLIAAVVALVSAISAGLFRLGKIA